MASQYTSEQWETILEFAEEHGDRATRERYAVPEGTLRSRRHRAERKVVDRRARDDDAAGYDEDPGASGAGSIVAYDLADVMVPTDRWNGAGHYEKVPARAYVVREAKLSHAFVSLGGRHELRLPDAHKFAPGEIILLGGERYKDFADALWRVVERRGDGVLVVEPAQLRAGEKLLDGGPRIVAKGSEDGPRGMSYEERLRNWDGQPDPRAEWHRRELARLEGRPA